MSRIPLTRRVNGGQLASNVSPNLGTQSIQATRGLAQAVGGVGQSIVNTGIKLARIENERLVSQYKAGLRRATAEYENELVDNHNPETWMKGYQEKVGSYMSENDLGKLSPEAKEAFVGWSEDYRGNQELRIARDAKLKGIKNSQLQLDNNMREYEARGDFESSRREYRESSLYSEEEKRRNDLETDKRESRWLEKEEARGIKVQRELEVENNLHEAHNNPREWIKNNPNPTGDYAAWKKVTNVANARVKELVLKQNTDVVNDFLNNEINLEDIESRTPDMDTSQRRDLVNHLEDLQDEDYRKYISSPEQQRKLYNEALRFATSANPAQTIDTDEELQFERALRQIEDPDLKKKVKSIYENSKGAFKNEISKKHDRNLKFGIKLIDGFFEKSAHKIKKPKDIVTPRSVREHINDGLFYDVAKLKRAGLSDAQIKTVTTATEEVTGNWVKDRFTNEEVTVRAQADALAKVWDERLGDVTADSETMRLLTDIAKKGRGSLDNKFSESSTPDKEALTDYHSKLNQEDREREQMTSEYADWVEDHPEATHDEVLKAIKDLGASVDTEAARKAKLSTQSKPTRLAKPLKLSNYGYSSDTTPDSYSRKSIGHASNTLRDGQSAAITKTLAVQLGLKRGAVIEIETTKGRRLVTYDDTVPSHDKRTGSLPPTIDIFRKSNGSNSWGGKVTGVRMVLQGRDGISGRKYTEFSENNYQRALKAL